MRKFFVWLAAALALFVVADRVADALFMRGVNRFFGLNRKCDILLVGHSHLMLATDKERMERELGVPVAKYTREGVGVSDRLAMVRHFLSLPAADSLRLCLYGVDLCTFLGDGLSSNSYKLFYPFMDNPDMDAYIRGQADATDYWLHRLVRTSRFADDGMKNAVVRGWRGDWSNRKNGLVDIEAYKARLERGDERHIQMNPELISQFRETVDLLTVRGVRVVLVNTPTLDLLNDWEPDKYAGVMAWFQAYADANPMVEFWDFNPQYASRHELFNDRLHLNAKGQEVITGEIIKRLRNL